MVNCFGAAALGRIEIEYVGAFPSPFPFDKFENYVQKEACENSRFFTSFRRS